MEVCEVCQCVNEIAKANHNIRAVFIWMCIFYIFNIASMFVIYCYIKKTHPLKQKKKKFWSW